MNGQLINKKLEIFEENLEALADDFSFNEDGDILVKDILTLIPEAFEIM